MVMADYFVHDRLQELWQQINQLHFTYLDTEDSPDKIQHRFKLESCVREYLCLAPHNRKFCYQETAEVLHRSASSKKDFSGYRAALAWNAIGMYAGNLFSQSWRKEYRQIKMYSGFYKHEIEANLVGAETMFEAMGYKHASDGVLVLEGPICPDRVANISQDSIVAFVECQILKTIWEEVSSNFKISWLDVLEFRESHLYSPEQSIRMLKYRYHEKRYQEQQRGYSQPTDTYTIPRYNMLNNHAVPHVMPHTTSVTSIHPYQNHTHMPSQSSHYVPITSHVQPCPAQCVYANPYYNYSTYAPPVPNSYPRFGTVPFPPITCQSKMQCHGNGYCYPNGFAPPPTYMAHPVPTGQLIELDNTQMYDVPDGTHKARQDVDAHKQLAKSTNLDSLTLSKSKEDGAGSFESWDYVYRNLESQGYSKDLGERGDVLQIDNKKSNVRVKKPVQKSVQDLENEFNNVNTKPVENEHNLTIDEALKRFSNLEIRKPKPDESKVAQSSSYDNISSQDVIINNKNVKLVSNGTAKTKTLPKERASVMSPEKSHATLDTKKLRKQDVDKLKIKDLKQKEKKKLEPEDAGMWNCNTCTYLNNPSVDICAMCGKSKRKVDVMMAVGGSQCPVCTLVNPKDVSQCQACEASLQNSATYI